MRKRVAFLGCASVAIWASLYYHFWPTTASRGNDISKQPAVLAAVQSFERADINGILEQNPQPPAPSQSRTISDFRNTLDPMRTQGALAEPPASGARMGASGQQPLRGPDVLEPYRRIWSSAPRNPGTSAAANAYFEDAFAKYDIAPRRYEIACTAALCRAEVLFASRSDLDRLNTVPRVVGRELAIGFPVAQGDEVALTMYLTTAAFPTFADIPELQQEIARTNPAH